MKTYLLIPFFAIILFLLPTVNFGQIQPPPPVLGDANSFAVFTSVGALTSDGATVVTGDVGSNVGGVVINPPGVVIGAIHDADGVSALAAPDVDGAYMYLDGILGGTVIGTTLGSGQTLTPDVYILGAASTLNGDLILDAEGAANAIFIFQIEGAFATTVNSSVTLLNGASLCNVYWQVNGAVTLGEGSTFLGTIVANGAIHALEAASLSGRALTRAGAIDLHNNNINNGLPIASIITANGATTFCAGGSVELSGNVGGVWSTGDITASIVVTAGGDYFVTNTGACGAIISNHIIVTVNALPICTITGDEITCDGESTELCTAAGAASYEWSNGGTTNCITVTLPGSYSVTVTDNNGCSSVCSETVIVGPAPVCTITGDNLIFEGESTELCTAAGAASYEWSNGETTNCITVNQAGTYSVTVTDANGCIAVCSIIVNPGESVCIIANVTPASCDYVFHCPNGLEPGQPCDDGNESTCDDVMNDLCVCEGTPSALATYSVCAQVDHKKDDAEEKISNGDMDLTSSDLEMVMDGSTKQAIGMRFNDLNIPQGATILSAYIQFTVDRTDNINPCNLDIFGQDSDNAIAFSDNDKNITKRPLTSAKVIWSPANWLVLGAAGAAQQTNNISSVIQEIVDRAGYNSNSSIAIIIKGVGKRTAVSYDEDEDEAPILCVVYESSDCPDEGDNDDDDCDDDYCDDDDCDVHNGDDENNGTGGSFELTVDCGVGPYNYTITSSGGIIIQGGPVASVTDLEIGNLAPDTYTVEVTDANGVTTICSVTITQEAMECIISKVEDATCAYMEQCPNGPEPGTLCDDGNPNTTNDMINEECDCVGTPDNGGLCTVCSQVDDGDDDAEEIISNGDIDIDNSDLEIVTDGSQKQLVGLRFNNLNIPQGAIIQSAYIQFTVDKTNNQNPISLEIYAENTDDAGAFDDNDGNISDRNKTVVFATWSPANWLNEGDSGPAQQTSDISAVIQAIVNRAGFTANSSIVIIIKGTGNRTAVSYDEDEDEAPILCVTFESSVCPDEGGNNDDDDDDDDNNGYGGSFELTIDCGVSPFDYTVTNTANEVVDFGTENEIDEIKIDNLAPGTYIIVVTDASGATTECEVTISQEMPCDGGGDRLAGDASKSETNVEIRPNPTAYQDVNILIDIKGGQRYTKHTILVSDISGHIVINESLLLEEGLSTYIIPNELLMNGIYFVRIQNQQGDVFVLRFVKIDED